MHRATLQLEARAYCRYQAIALYKDDMGLNVDEESVWRGFADRQEMGFRRVSEKCGKCQCRNLAGRTHSDRSCQSFGERICKRVSRPNTETE